jgi:2-octaprenylphenol hydroxylase
MAVIILGAGIVGLTLANLLAQNDNLAITLIDTKEPDYTWDATYYDARCSAINHATQDILCHAGVWDAIIAERVGVYERMLVWDDLEHNAIEFTAAILGMKNLGHIIENRLIQRTLDANLDSYPNVKKVQAQVQRLQVEEQCVYLHSANECYSAQLVLGADGANSWLRQQVGIAVTEHDYQQQALVATIRAQHEHQRTAMQRFTTTGTVAFLPLDELHTSSIVWASTPAHVQQLLELNATDFCNELETAFNYKLGALELHGKRMSFPLRRLDAQRYIAPRVALLGDAAHVVHPLAGQGLNIGMLDAQALAQILQVNIKNNLDLGCPVRLRNYERQARSNIMLPLIDHLHKTFAMQNPLVKAVRHAGIRLLNNSALAKATMARFAIGTLQRGGYV